MWPFKRKRRVIEIVVRHEVGDTLALELGNLAVTMERCAKIRTGWIHPKLKEAPPPPPIPEQHVLDFEKWLLGKQYEDTRRDHYRALFQIVRGVRAPSGEFTRTRCREELESVGAPLPLY